MSFLRLSAPLLTAHHPFCEQFEGHTWLGRKWCIGCFFSSIAFFSTLSLLLFLWKAIPSLIVRDQLYLVGAMSVVISLGMSIAGLTERKSVKAPAKILLGMGFASFVVGVLISGGTVESYLLGKIFFVMMVYLPIITLMNYRRYREIERVCGSCEYHMRWSICPGLGEIVCSYFKEGFLQEDSQASQDD
ncbi:MAG: hypothetical protein ACTSPE_13520 [Candidatus Thorarchaeota archaeon]